MPADGALGFCAACEVGYLARRLTRQRLATTVCARLRAVGDPLFAVFGGRPHAFGAHVVAHLEELQAEVCHVPRAAVADYVQEIDEERRAG